MRWWYLRAPGALIVAMMLGWSSHAGLAATAVHDLDSAQLQPGDVPPVYSVRGVGVYPRYATRLVVPHRSISCNSPTAGARRNWREGMIVTMFDRHDRGFLECAFLLTTAAGAHTVYAFMKNEMESSGPTQSIASRRIGDESILVIASGTQKGYGGLFRRANAVVAYAYAPNGKFLITPAAFARLGQRLEARLK